MGPRWRLTSTMYASGPIPRRDHIILLGEFFAVCQENHTRLKLGEV